MSLTARDIEKLKALGLRIQGAPQGPRQAEMTQAEMELQQWADIKECVQSSWLKATMADKVRWLNDQTSRAVIIEKVRSRYQADAMLNPCVSADGDSPEAAVDALFWKVP